MVVAVVSVEAVVVGAEVVVVIVVLVEVEVEVVVEVVGEAVVGGPLLIQQSTSQTRLQQQRWQTYSGLL